MPSSVGLWLSAFAESLLDDLKLLDTAYELNDQCPLGSAASYGVAIAIDREFTAKLLGFAKVQHNVLYANNSRGKMEALTLNALSQIMLDLSKLAEDLILFTMPEFGYFTIPQELLTGSSIMPQKKNPQALELVRARTATLCAAAHEVGEIIRALPSGYNGDFPQTKGPLLRGFEITLPALQVVDLVVGKMGIKEKALRSGFTPEIFAADKALEMAQEGKPFREAYREVARDLDSLRAVDPEANIRSKKHVGAPGNLGLETLLREIKEARRIAEKKEKTFRRALDALAPNAWP